MALLVETRAAKPFSHAFVYLSQLALASMLLVWVSETLKMETWLMFSGTASKSSEVTVNRVNDGTCCRLTIDQRASSNTPVLGSLKFYSEIFSGFIYRMLSSENGKCLLLFENPFTWQWRWEPLKTEFFENSSQAERFCTCMSRWTVSTVGASRVSWLPVHVLLDVMLKQWEYTDIRMDRQSSWIVFMTGTLTINVYSVLFSVHICVVALQNY